MIEVEMVQHDVESLAVALNQNQLMMVSTHTIISNEIYKQYNLLRLKIDLLVKPLFEVREERTSIDFDKIFTNNTN
jgi:hypothetical protein